MGLKRKKTLRLGFVKVTVIEWDIEYILRKELGITTFDLDNMSVEKMRYFLDKIKRENEEMQKAANKSH